MKRNAIVLAAALLAPFALVAQQSGNTGSGNTAEKPATIIGKMSAAQFEKTNKEGAAKVAAIKPTNTPLSAADKALMMEVAKGGMMQLAVSQAALAKATRPEVRELAQAEVEEQTGLSNKLKEIAAAKSVELPTQPDSETQALLTRMNDLSGNDLDEFYVSESGVKGHQKLEAVMAKAKAQAKDSNLKSVATTALPLVKTHLQVSRAISGAAKMDGAKTNGSGK